MVISPEHEGRRSHRKTIQCRLLEFERAKERSKSEIEEERDVCVCLYMCGCLLTRLALAFELVKEVEARSIVRTRCRSTLIDIS